MAFLNNSKLALVLFLLITTGNAYPYTSVYTHFFKGENCSCCIQKKKGCAHCATYGHKPVKKKFSCHKAAPPRKSEPLVKSIPCATPTQRVMVSFVLDPFLIPQNILKLPTLIWQPFPLELSVPSLTPPAPRIRPPIDRV